MKDRRLAQRLLIVALALAAIPAASAQADSIAYLKNSNVWIAHPDGSGQYQVTHDGTGSDPYTSVSQSDNGTIVAGRGKRIYRMTQNGTLLNAPIRVAAPNKTANPNELTQPAPDEDTSPPRGVEVTPDGSKVAFSYLGRCYRSSGGIFGYVPCPMIGLTYSNRFTAPSEMTGNEQNEGRDPVWISNSRYAEAGESSTEIYVDDAPIPNCSPAPSCHTAFWLHNCYAGAPQGCEGAVQPAVSRSGRRIVVVSQNAQAQGYRLVFYESQTGPPPDGYPPPSEGGTSEPQPKCLFSDPTGGEFSDPAWSPDGSKAAWTEGDGIHVAAVASLDDCGSLSNVLAIPGGSDPSWGPANVNPNSGGTTPKLSALRVTPAAFRAKRGATVSFALSSAASVRVTVQRAKGTRYVNLASESLRGRAGANNFKFSPRIKGRLLSPGRYRLLVVATSAGKRSGTVRASFRIKR